MFKCPSAQTPDTSGIADPADVFRLFISNKRITDRIVLNTNKEANRISKKCRNDTDCCEIRAVIGCVLPQ